MQNGKNCLPKEKKNLHFINIATICSEKAARVSIDKKKAKIKTWVCENKKK